MLPLPMHGIVAMAMQQLVVGPVVVRAVPVLVVSLDQILSRIEPSLAIGAPPLLFFEQPEWG